MVAPFGRCGRRPAGRHKACPYVHIVPALVFRTRRAGEPALQSEAMSV